MTDDERGLLLTVARIMRARLGDPGGIAHDDEDLHEIKEALKPFDPSDEEERMMAFTDDGPSEPMTTELLRVDKLEAENKRLRDALKTVRDTVYKNRETPGLIALEKEITEGYGKRCSEFDPSCPTCGAWALFDKVKTILSIAR